MSDYTMAEIEQAWDNFRVLPVYRCLVAGSWMVRTSMAEARKLSPLKIEMKKAKDCLDFPSYLKATTNDGN
jgi:hypothetical protein